MTDSTADDRVSIEQLRLRIGQAGFMTAGVGLSVGIALFLLQQGPVATWTLTATVSVLMALPIVNVVAVLAEEVRQRDWSFAGLAVGVLAILGWAVVSRVVQALQYKSL